MRPLIVPAWMMLLIGICAAQDTNFSVGPQYLITGSSPSLLQPIATPTLSFTPPPVRALSGESGASGTEQVVYTPARVPAAELPQIYGAAANAGENTGEIGITSEETSPLPAGFINVGVAEMVDPQSLRENGNGMSLAQAAAFWRAHRTSVVHVYTNADIARLHGG